MRAFPALILCAAACVSETRGPSGEIVAEEENGPSPVETAEAQVAALIRDLPRRSGADLLGALDRIAFYKTLALRPIGEALAKADPRTRSHLVYVLGVIGGSDAHRLIASRLGDADPVVRFEAASALLDANDISGVPVLIAYLRDGDKRIRYKAFESLKRFTKQDFGYDFAAAEPAREAAVAKWDAWWSKTRAEMLYVGNSERPASVQK
ncbi:MAG TPA: HEAT repeat domain-containing protein [Planctomycetota bacterium]|nr:HEAT repeat domain-containing protein [Planctomycetota bacterium]